MCNQRLIKTFFFEACAGILCIGSPLDFEYVLYIRPDVQKLKTSSKVALASELGMCRICFSLPDIGHVCRPDICRIFRKKGPNARYPAHPHFESPLRAVSVLQTDWQREGG